MLDIKDRSNTPVIKYSKYAYIGILTILGCVSGISETRAEVIVQPSEHIYTVQAGNTLTQVAHKFGISTAELAAQNNLHKHARLLRGSVLHIRSGHIAAASSADRTENNSVVSSSSIKQAEKRISLNFSDVSARQALSTISDYSGTDIVVMPGGDDLISISLRNRTAEEAIRLTSAAAGLSVVRTNGAYIVGKPDQINSAVGNIGQGAASPMLKTSAFTSKDFPYPLVPVKNETGIITLHFIDPALAEHILAEAFPSLHMVRQERIIVLTGGSETLLAVDAALKQIDIEPPIVPKTSRAFVYRLKYLNAETAEISLKKVLPSLNIAVAPEPTSPPPASFQPLSTNTLNAGADISSSTPSSSTQQSASGGAISQSSNTVEAQHLSRSVRLILLGSENEVEQAKDLLDQTDVAPPLVRIEAAIVEVNRDNMKDLGMAWDFGNTSFTFTVPGGTGLDFSKIQRDLPRPDVSNPPAANFTVSIKALITQNRARILANPNISVVDNEDANIFIGDLLRFPGATTTTQNATIQSIDTIPIGIALLVRPRIHPNGEVTLKVHPVVSSISGFNTVNGQSQPQTSSREADTTVRLRTGQELVIGGLSRKELTSNLTKVPFLGDLPFLGQFFQSRSQGSKETEILIFIRAYPVLTQAAPPDQSFLLPKEALQRNEKADTKRESK